jgi:hypothetical protein
VNMNPVQLSLLVEGTLVLGIFIAAVMVFG